MTAVPAALAAGPAQADSKIAEYCKAFRGSKGVEAFGTSYTKNANTKNAYGTCVSQTAKAEAAKREDAKEQSVAMATCKKSGRTTLRRSGRTTRVPVSA